MEPLTLAAALGKAIGIGLAANKAWKVADVGTEELALLGKTMASLPSFRAALSGPQPALNADGVPAIHLGLVVRAFGVALARHWAGSENFVPVGRYLWGTERAQQLRIKRRLTIAAAQLVQLGDTNDPQHELSASEELASGILRSTAYKALWDAFSEEGLDDGKPLLVAASRAEFERHALLAWHELLSSSNGQALREWMGTLKIHRQRIVREVLAGELAGWGGRHVFGNTRADSVSQSDPLPFLPLDAMYVEPAARLVHRTRFGAPGSVLKQFANALRTKALVVVRADFGSGKSLTARRIARDLAADWLYGPDTSSTSWYPVHIRCADHLPVEKKPEALIRRAMWALGTGEKGPGAIPDGPPTNDECYAPPGSEQRTLVILDGLDEVSLSTEEANVALQSDRTPPLHPRWHKTWASGV
jgi:hypothetical protein